MGFCYIRADFWCDYAGMTMQEFVTCSQNPISLDLVKSELFLLPKSRGTIFIWSVLLEALWREGDFTQRSE